jgi:hypothetical protein
LNNYLTNHDKHEEEFLDTILNLQFSNGTIRSSIDKSTPVNYDLLTQTMSHHSTPSIRTFPSFLYDNNQEQTQNYISNEQISLDYQSSPIFCFPSTCSFC